MERPVIIAVFERGGLQSVRTLSPGRERWAAAVAGLCGGGLVLASMALAAGMIRGFGLVVHAPTFFLSWLGVAAAVGVFSARWVRARVSRYRVGADIDADAFAMSTVDLVRRSGEDYEIGLVPGMSGTIDQGRSAVPIESFTRRGPTEVPLPENGKAHIEIGSTTFVITRRVDSHSTLSFYEQFKWVAEAARRRLVRAAAVGTPIAALATAFGAVPAAMAMTDDGRFSIPESATPLQVERLIRAKAQFQASTLHRCFDPLPVFCQRSGYVGVGLALSRSGEVIDHWTARSSYGEECPVTSCIEQVVADWAYEPMKQGMNVIIPVQVKRTAKPLVPPQSVIFVQPYSATDAGPGCADAPRLD